MMVEELDRVAKLAIQQFSWDYALLAGLSRPGMLLTHCLTQSSLDISFCNVQIRTKTNVLNRSTYGLFVPMKTNPSKTYLCVFAETKTQVTSPVQFECFTKLLC